MDISLALWLHNTIPWNDKFLWFFEQITRLGYSQILLFFVIIATVYLTLTARFNMAHMIVLAAITSSIASSIIKSIVQRPRPDIWLPYRELDSYSFPSGHAITTMAIYGMAIFFLAESYPKAKRPIYAVGGVILFLVGLSRVYLGVHWPSDVLCGWLIGGLILWGMIWWYLNGGIKRTARIMLGISTLVIGLVGLAVPIIPGIPLIIAACLLIFFNRSFSEMFKRKK